ncbi:ead/Ea22-like family protein [Enterobacter cloacae]|uniref:ead/Ea22-like family protein n=1 Tax=Enterobacter cloacae TaxID=550 RepID=UPI003905A92B
MSNIDKQALREAAEKATPGEWKRMMRNSDELMTTFHGIAIGNVFVELTTGKRDIFDAEFIAASNPATMLALLDELDANERQNAELTEALKQTVSGYKSCLRTGHERILDLGGDCDSPEVMIAGNPDIQLAEKLIAAAAAKGE